MNKFSTAFYRIIQVSIAVALAALFIAVFISLKSCSRNEFAYELSWVIFGALFSGIAVIFLPIQNRVKLCIILALAFLVRLWFFLRVPTGIVSDYATMYESAKGLLKGDLNPYHGFGYLARFPHLVPMSLYMAGMIILFPTNHLIAMRFFHVLLSVLTVYLIYRLAAYFMKNEKVRLATALIAGVYPALFTYPSTYATENLAMPFFLLSVLLLLRHREDTGKKAVIWSAVTGAVLFMTQLFRGLGIIFMIAFLMYLLLFTGKGKLTRAISLFISYALCLSIFSGILMGAGVLERPIWKGSEPITATALLRGSNLESFGTWNVEDAQFVDEHLGDENLSKLCFQKAAERFTSIPLPQLLYFFGYKFINQWFLSDFSGTYWAFFGTDLPYPYPQALPAQLIFCGMLLLSFISLLTKKKNARNMVFWLLLCGFGTLFAVIETQGRYSYIVAWAFVLMAGAGLERLTHLIQKLFNRNQVNS